MAACSSSQLLFGGVSSHSILDAVNASRNNNSISLEEIDAIMRHPLVQNKDEGIFLKTATKLIRTIIKVESKKYLLLTSTFRRGDRLLGKGRFKKAKLAIDLETSKRYVVAACKKDGLSERGRNSLLREIGAMESLKGKKNIIQIEESVESSEKYYIFMEYCEQGSLSTALMGQPLTLQEQLKVACDCAAGLANMHEAGFLHRDIKPGNIFLYLEEGKLAAKIGDLGRIGKENEENWRCLIRGDWNDPQEGASNEDDILTKETRAGDVWSLGLVFYVLFYHGPPSESYLHVPKIKNNPDEFYAELDRSSIHPKILSLIKQMLSLDRNQRPTMAKVLGEMREIKNELESESTDALRADDHFDPDIFFAAPCVGPPESVEPPEKRSRTEA